MLLHFLVVRSELSLAHHNVPSSHKLQSGLHNEDVENINAITEVIHQQPPVNVLRRLVRESAAHRDQPNIPVPRERHKEQPHHVGQVCEESERISRPTVFSMHAIIQHI